MPILTEFEAMDWPSVIVPVWEVVPSVIVPPAAEGINEIAPVPDWMVVAEGPPLPPIVTVEVPLPLPMPMVAAEPMAPLAPILTVWVEREAVAALPILMVFEEVEVPIKVVPVWLVVPIVITPVTVGQRLMPPVPPWIVVVEVFPVLPKVRVL